MTSAVLASPYVPPPPPVPRWSGLQQTWTGVDGSVWDLCDDPGVFLTDDGSIVGMHYPPVDDYVTEAPSVDGQRYRGGRVLAREVQWTVAVWSDKDSAEWVERDRSWWQSMSPYRQGTWRVTTQTGQSRTLRCRLTSDGGHQHQPDPALFGWAVYPVSLIADDPFWYGDPLVVSGWSAPKVIPFFGGTTHDGLVHVSAGSDLGAAVITNPGDVATWLRWTIRGPVTSGTLTVDGGELGVPAVPAGQTLIIDTDPTVATATRNGVDVTGLVDPWDPRPLPPGANVPIGIDIVGGDGWYVTADAPTKFWRAW